MRLILDKLRYDSPERSDTRARQFDVYNPGPIDVQPSGCTIPIIGQSVLTCAIPDELITSLPDASPQ